MIEFGRTLREAREAKGYTIGQVAESTRLMSSMVEDLERENFSRIAAPIYGRGFVKLYCEAVGLDPKPLVAEFMEIFSGSRDIAIRERPVASADDAGGTRSVASANDTHVAPPETAHLPPEPTPEPAPSPAPSPAARLPPADSLFDFVASPTDVPPVSAPAPTSEAPRPEGPRLTRYSAPLESTGPTRKMPHFRLPELPRIPPVVWRLGALALAALLVLWLLLIGVRALYRATTGTNRPVPAAASVAEPAKATPPVAPPKAADKPSTAAAPAIRVKRAPQKIPALYID